MSFSLTAPQVRAGTKTVTRRLGWDFLRPGARVMACVKIRGLRPGEKIQRIREIEITETRVERLDAMTKDAAYGLAECSREGFPELEPEAFLEMFCRSHRGCVATSEVTRIAFRYV